MFEESNYTLDTLNVGLTIILIFLNGFFVAAEFAMVKLSTNKVKTMIAIKTSIPDCIQNLEKESSGENSLQITATCVFPPSFSGFKGHFPGNPILPAIVQLATVRQITETILGINLIPHSYTKTKFRGMVKPDQEIIIRITVSTSEMTHTGTFNIRTASSDPVADGKFIFIPEHKK